MAKTTLRQLGLVALSGAVLATVAACASGSNAGMSGPASAVSFCSVVIENATAMPLNLAYRVGILQHELGLSEAGESHAIGVPCDAGQVWARGVTPSNSESGYDDFRTRVTIAADPSIETRIRLTPADRVRRP